jgi:methionyl-tRNA synthetase
LGEDDDRAGNVLYNCLAVAKASALLLEPVMPSAAERVWDTLDEGDIQEATLEDAFEPVEGALEEPEHLFEQVEDEKIEKLEARLQERIGDDEESDDEDEADELPFERFEELDIRVARVVEAEPIEDSDSLLLLRVDIGDETRQVVAGLKGLHEPDALVGERVVVVTNLETATIFGYDSEAMLLAAGEDADLLTTAGDSEPGTEVM